ncbi:ZIP family metal transporter [Candidatus Pacearchaeota archaeon]|nr:ZIP family metal transporter [Candidatus Pacearchaeota archaeon]
MSVLYWIILMTLLNGFIALAGAVSFLLTKKNLKKITIFLVSFSIGSLLGGAFIHFIPEAIEELLLTKTVIFVLLGIAVFYVLEKVLHWHHCHEGECKVHPAGYLLLYGDAIHNFLDGLIIAGSFLINIPFGIITSILIILHEFPQEIADIGVLIHGGFAKKKALLYNFIAQLTSVLGGIVGFFFIKASNYVIFLLPFAAGGFIYIALGDLIPEVLKEKDPKRRIINLLSIILGLSILVLAKVFVG